MAGEMLEALTVSHGLDRQQLQRVTLCFTQVIERSFIDDRSRMTGSEVRRRFKILERWFRELRAEHGWSVTRILDELPTILRGELDGAPFDPTAHGRLWTP